MGFLQGMQYVYSYELAALCVMLVIFLHFQFNNRFFNMRVSYFRAFLACAILEAILNIMSGVFINSPDIVPVWFSVLECYAFFLIEACSSYLFFLYVIEVCENREKIYIRIFSVPYFLYTILVLTNEWHHLLFTFTREGAYFLGRFYQAEMIYAIVYLLICLYLIILYRERIHIKYTFVVFFYTVASFLAISIQLVTKTYLMMGMANALVIMNMYLFLQNPKESIDLISGANNERAFLTNVEYDILQKKPIAIIILQIKLNQYMHMVMNYRTHNALQERIADFLKSITGNQQVYRLNQYIFAVVLHDKSVEDELVLKIQERFLEEWEFLHMKVHVHINLFVEEYGKNFMSLQELNGVLTVMLEDVMKANADVIVWPDDEQQKCYQRRTRVEYSLNKALSHGTLEVFYQPIYGVKEKKIVALEALVRLRDAEMGVIPPDEFIDIAEANGSILALQEHVLEKVCRFAAERILPYPELGIEELNINISVVQCMQPDMVEKTMAIIDKCKIPHQMINLEITERLAVTSYELMRTHMERFKRMGIRFSLDDYGTGNSNLTYLINFSFDRLKFDKGMVWNYFEKDSAKLILDHEFELVRKIGIPMVLEGIETQEQFDAVRELGVEYLQGYYFSAPKEESAIVEYLQYYNMK